MESRQKRVFENANHSVQAILIFNGTRIDPNFFYLTGYRAGLFERSAVCLKEDGSLKVLTTPLEEPVARQKSYEVIVQRSYSPTDTANALRSLVGDEKAVGVNYKALSHFDYVLLRKALRGIKLVDISEALEKTRLIKDQDEIDALSEAAKIVSKVADSVPSMLVEGMTEKELKAKIEYEMVRLGADSPSFESIVAFGENSAIPHYAPSLRRLKKGDTVLIDIGSKYALYCSDLTRTMFYAKVDKVQEEMYYTVLTAQEKAFSQIRDGVKASEPHFAAQNHIDSTRFKGTFIHSLGHSIGIEVHDGLGMGPKSEHVLRENMALTVEPGVYVQGVGGVRIEDDIVVTATGYRQLTSAKRELLVV